MKKRKESVGNFLACVRKVTDLKISIDDFGNCCHMASSEPYFYDQSYANGKTQKTPIPVDEQAVSDLLSDRLLRKIWHFWQATESWALIVASLSEFHLSTSVFSLYIWVAVSTGISRDFRTLTSSDVQLLVLTLHNSSHT